MSFDLSSKKQIGLLSFIIVIIMATMFSFRVSNSQNQIISILNERSLDISQRVAKAVAPSVWNIFKKSTDRYFSESIASAILDAELSGHFVTGIKVYGNFGHLFLGRFKMPNGLIQNYHPSKEMIELIKMSSSNSSSVKMGTMSIGKVEVYYYDKNLSDKLNTIIIAEAAQVFIPTLFMLLSLYFIYRTTKANKETNKVLKELQQTQDWLIESEKLASMGSLVAGVAHEINTPLGNAIICTSIVVDKTQDLKTIVDSNTLKASELNHYIKSVNESLVIAEKNLNRVVKLINTFKQVASDHILEDMRMINVIEYIEELMITLIPKLKQQHVNYVITGDRTATISTIPGGLAQIITNLFNNSLLHGFKDLTSGNIEIHVTSHSDKSITISFKDDGRGMTEVVQKHIFEPFFTTKRNKGGTGLGMNIVYNVTNKKLQGSIEIISKVGEGSTFILNLPKTLTDYQ